MTYKLDEKDIKIMKLLKEQGDLTTGQLSKKTLLPATTVHNRIKKLKKEKIIKFTIDVDNSKIGKGFLSYVLVSVNLPMLKEKRKTQYDLIRELLNCNFVERADIVSGGTDIVVTVRVKDVEEFDKVLLQKLQLIEGIEKTQSLIVIH